MSQAKSKKLSEEYMELSFMKFLANKVPTASKKHPSHNFYFLTGFGTGSVEVRHLSKIHF